MQETHALGAAIGEVLGLGLEIHTEFVE